MFRIEDIRNPHKQLPNISYVEYMQAFINKDYLGKKSVRSSSRSELSPSSKRNVKKSVSKSDKEEHQSSSKCKNLKELREIYQKARFIFEPGTRKCPWPGVALPPSNNGVVSDQNEKQLYDRILQKFDKAFKIRKINEDREMAEAALNLDPESCQVELKESDEEFQPQRQKMGHVWWMLKEDEDFPIDLEYADTFVRPPLQTLENAPRHVIKEQEAVQAFQQYLDKTGVSELVIGILMMMYEKPCYPEEAKELVRRGLGGKPMKVATTADILKEIEITKERIKELEKELKYLQTQVLRLLKEETHEEPEDPTNPKTPMRRMEYVLREFRCRTKPEDVPFDELYDLSEIPGLAKYKVKLPKKYEELGREMTGGAAKTVDKGVSTNPFHGISKRSHFNIISKLQMK